MICTKCKQEIVQGMNFCPNCGKRTAPYVRKPKRAGNGTGTAYKRGQTWTAECVVGWRDLPPFDAENPANKKQRIPIKRTRSGFKTKQEALAYIPILKAGGTKSDQSPVLSEYWKIYERDELSKLCATKQRCYDMAWRRLSPLHASRVSTISVADLRRVVSEAASTYQTAKDCKTLLSSLFTLAAADGHANKDLPSFIVLPDHEEKEKETFSDLEQAALWKQYETGDIRVAPILLMIYSGMMPGELLNLRADQIDLTQRMIIGAGMKTKIRKKTPIVLAENIIPVVQDLIDHAQPDGHILPTSKDRDWRDKYYYPALRDAGCRKLTPYSCRHTTATALAITEGIAPQTIQKVMRWSSTRMLDRYAHPDQNAALEAVDTIKKQSAK